MRAAKQPAKLGDRGLYCMVKVTARFRGIDSTRERSKRSRELPSSRPTDRDFGTQTEKPETVISDNLRFNKAFSMDPQIGNPLDCFRESYFMSVIVPEATFKSFAERAITR